MTTTDPLIRLDRVTKVFYAEDMETHALSEVDLEIHRAKHLPGQLSGGQQQRAVVGTPAILLCDEPTGNLDSKNGAMVMDLLQELHAEGATICMVTHDPRYADCAERTIHLFDGRLVEGAAVVV